MNPLYTIDMAKKSLRARESGVPGALREHARDRVGAVESKGSDGTFLIRIITEGKGSSGIYSRELIQGHATAFDGFKSFFDHPEYSFAPEERSVLGLAGRLVPGTIELGETEDGLAAAYAKYKPREEYRQFFEDFMDVLGISIYVGATFSITPNGERNVESFDANDPYGSVDVVVAAGRGGRFESARESLRTIESALGVTRGNKPSAEASAQEKEGNMLTKEEVEAVVAEAVAPLVTALSELTTAATEKATAEANAEAVDTAVTEALSSYDEKVQAIAAEKDLLDSQRAALTESARKGNDITAELADAKAFATEAKAAFSAAPLDDNDAQGVVLESGDSKLSDADFITNIAEGKHL